MGDQSWAILKPPANPCNMERRDLLEAPQLGLHYADTHDPLGWSTTKIAIYATGANQRFIVKLSYESVGGFKKNVSFG